MNCAHNIEFDQKELFSYIGGDKQNHFHKLNAD